MTNEEAKQEAIKKAFKESGYEKLLPLNVNGWVKVKPHQYINSSLFERLKINSGIHSIRPKSLKHLDNNNGWIRIEPNGSNLPEKGEYRWLFESGVMSNFYYEPGDVMSVKLTHYKQITPELKPIY